MLTHAEMYGIPGYSFTAITEEHYVSAESMQAYSSVFDSFGLNKGEYDSKNIQKKSKFR